MSRREDPDRWVRVRDVDTGHQYDVRARAIRRGMEPLDNPRYPDLAANRQPRRHKQFVDKAGSPAAPKPPDERAPVDPPATPPTTEAAPVGAASSRSGRPRPPITPPAAAPAPPVISEESSDVR